MCKKGVIFYKKTPVGSLLLNFSFTFALGMNLRSSSLLPSALYRCLALAVGLCLLVSMHSRAQEVVFGDTLPTLHLPELHTPQTAPAWMQPTFSPQLPSLLPPSDEGALSSRLINESIRQSAPAPPQYFLRWDEGSLTGFNRTDVYPLVGSNATAGLSATHRFSDRLTLTGSAAVHHFVAPYTTLNSASTSALLSYQLSGNVSLSAFGLYQSPSFMSNERTPSTWQYGGYMTLHTDNHRWGVDMGARRQFNPYTGRVESVPILMPYYNLQGQKLGIDFGGILKSLIINQQMRRSFNNAPGGAPIAPGPPPNVLPAWLK